jgi:hypothetical protein
VAPPLHPYLELLSERAPAASAWLRGTCERLTPATFPAAYASSGRRFGMEPVSSTAKENARLAEAGLVVPLGWLRRDLARSLLLSTLVEALDEVGANANTPAPACLSALFRTSDNAEREALLKTLPMLPRPERFLDTAVEACRTHVQSVFEAIACENAYPARHFPDLNFNQLVLKAFFLEIAVRRIVGLNERNNPELVRMADAYASERTAAGRSVPSDLDAVTSKNERSP